MVALEIVPSSPGNVCLLPASEWEALALPPMPPARIASSLHARISCCSSTSGNDDHLGPTFLCALAPRASSAMPYVSLYGPRVFSFPGASLGRLPAMPSSSDTDTLVSPSVYANAEIEVIQPVDLDRVVLSVLRVKGSSGFDTYPDPVKLMILARHLDKTVVANGYIVETESFIVMIHSHSDPSASYGRISDLFTQLSFPAHVRSSTSGQITTPLKLEERSLESTPGLAVVHRHLSQLLLGPGAHAAYYAALATSPSRGLLLSGPPGVGKTWAVAQACAAAGAELHCVSAADMHSPYPGETEARLRDAFARAAAAAQARSGVVALFLDEIDAIAPVRDASASSTTARAVAQLLTLLDGAAGTDARVVVIAATNRPNAIDPAVRRPGRLDRELVLDPPTAATRADILRALLAKVPVAPNVLSEDWIGRVAECLPGYVGADLAAVVREACRDLMVRVQAHEAECGVSRDDLLRAIKSVPPSLRRGHVVQVQASGSHKTSGWEDIGGLEDVKKKIIQAVVWPLQHAEKFTRLGLRPPHGLLLYGPPGCSKTTLVRVLASELRSAFYTLTPADVYSSLVGDAERTVRAAFARARATSPSILFLDEIDALVGGDRLGSGSDGGGATDDVKSRVLLTLLAEMDGIEDANRRPVLVVAATNHPGKLDAALVRAGRIDRAVYVRPPRADERTAIVQVYTRRMPLHTSVDLAAIAARLEGATGAEIEAVCREAALASLRANADAVTIDHFDAAVRAWRPMVGPEMVQYYEDLALRFK